jgi:protein SCO1/2
VSGVRKAARLAGVAALALSAAAFAAAPGGAEPIDQAGALKLSQAAMGRSVGDHTLRASDGSAVRLASLRGKPVLISFIYTGCFQVCPTTTRTLKRAVESAQRALGADSFHVLSVGFNQPFDTPEAMGAFARQQNIYLPNWRFVSPDPRTLAGLAQDLGFSWRESAGGFDHITQVTVLDQGGRVYRQVYGDSFPLPQLVGPLKELLTGSPPPDETVAGLLERVRILCTVYDPVTGEYRFKRSILFEMAGGAVGLTLIAWFMVRELRKTRRGARGVLGAPRPAVKHGR